MYLSQHVSSETAKKTLEADAQKAQEIRDMVLEVWQQAEENYKGNEGIDSKNNTTKNGFTSFVDVTNSKQRAP